MTVMLRPVDESGDMLPVLSHADMMKGAQAVARLVRDRLSLFSGEWWENPSWGNEILEMLRQSRLTEADGQALAAYLSSYVRETEGVEEVSAVQFSAQEKQFRFSCVVQTESGTAEITYEA